MGSFFLDIKFKHLCERFRMPSGRSFPSCPASGGNRFCSPGIFWQRCESEFSFFFLPRTDGFGELNSFPVPSKKLVVSSKSEDRTIRKDDGQELHQLCMGTNLYLPQILNIFANNDLVQLFIRRITISAKKSLDGRSKCNLAVTIRVSF
jgi:hypothetical protein